MPTWGTPLRRGLRLARAIRQPTTFVRVGARLLMGAAGLSWLIYPILAIVLPLINEAFKRWNEQMAKIAEENRFNLGRIQAKAEREKEDFLLSEGER
jgi:hypothetical protein